MVCKQLEWFWGRSINLRKWKVRWSGCVTSPTCFWVFFFLGGGQVWGSLFVYPVVDAFSRRQFLAQLTVHGGGGGKVKRREWGGGDEDEQQASVSIATVPSPTAAHFLLCWGAERRAGMVVLCGCRHKTNTPEFPVKFGSPALSLNILPKSLCSYLLPPTGSLWILVCFPPNHVHL